MLYCGVVEPKEQIITHYFGGLKHVIHEKVQLQPHIIINDIVKLHIKV